MDKETWLRCLVSPGQFSSEYAVQGKTFNGATFSLFAPDGEVETNAQMTSDRPVEGRIRVVPLDRNGALVLIQLPRQTLGNGRTITVMEDQLELRTARQEA